MKRKIPLLNQDNCFCISTIHVYVDSDVFDEQLMLNASCNCIRIEKKKRSQFMVDTVVVLKRVL